jgi:flavin-dependent dehydrogenase
VIILEAGSYPRHRVCGEFLCGVQPDTLETLGITDLLEGAPELTEAIWFRDGKRVVRHGLPIPGRGMSRHRLDHQLAIRFREMGGTLRERERLPPERWAEPGTVVATGREPDPDSDLIGLKRHLRNLPLQAGLEMHCAPGGYIGLCPIEDGQVNASALFRLRPELKGSRETLQRQYLLACGFHELVERMDQATPEPDSCAAVSAIPPGRLPHRQGTGPRLCSIGDRFGMIGPFTGNGMSMALESAVLAAPALADYSRGVRDWKGAIDAVQRRQTCQFSKRLLLSATLHRALFHPVALPLLTVMGRSGLLPMRFLFRQLR